MSARAWGLVPYERPAVHFLASASIASALICYRRLTK
jgi:hypothetical protein